MHWIDDLDRKNSSIIFGVEDLDDNWITTMGRVKNMIKEHLGV